MSGYINFDAALEESRGKREPVRKTLVAFRLGGDDFLVTQMPGSVFLRAAVIDGDGTQYDPTTPEGREAIARDGAAIISAYAGLFRDLLGPSQYNRFMDALGRSGMDIVEMYEFTQKLIGKASEAATARPTELPSDSASSPSSDGTSSSPSFDATSGSTVPVS